MSRDGTNPVMSKYWWKEFHNQYDTQYEFRNARWGSPEYMLWRTSRLPEYVLKRGYRRKLRSTIGRKNPNRIWYWEERAPGEKHDAHLWERRVGKQRAIIEELLDYDAE